MFSYSDTPVYDSEPVFLVINFLMCQNLFPSFTHKVGDEMYPFYFWKIYNMAFIIFIVFRFRNRKRK